jgi:S-adenosylmethionine:tRNA ribosyltransferase-isomerase
MLALDRATGAITDAAFVDLPEFLRAGDLLVLNDSRVIPARLFGRRAGLATQAGSPAPSGVVEVLLTEEVGEGPGKALVWRALVKPAKKVPMGERLQFFEAGQDSPALTAEVIAAEEYGERTLRFGGVEDFYGVLGQIGHMPLPPYIRREQARQDDAGAKAPNSAVNFLRGPKPAATPSSFRELESAATSSGGHEPWDVEQEDRERYQTVYSQEPGSAAAPTAGLHFTPEVLAALQERGVEIRYVTLHVGLGTFQPVRVEQVEDIRLHAERYTLPEETAEALRRALREGRRVVAVGTTTSRTLEHVAREAGASDGDDWIGGIQAHSGSTSIFLSPGYRFRIVSGLMTNFHLPESTLLMLVCAFAGTERVLAAYGHAVEAGYRFYSYGDCMLVG